MGLNKAKDRQSNLTMGKGICPGGFQGGRVRWEKEAVLAASSYGRTSASRGEEYAPADSRVGLGEMRDRGWAG